jgi:FixJ family two-component response regulator
VRDNHLVLPPHTRIDRTIAMPGVVVVVDDDQHILDALGMWLDQRQQNAAYYHSGESLLQAIDLTQGQLMLRGNASHPQARLVVGAVLDLNLPGITGVALAKSLRQLAPTMPLAIITALRADERMRYGQVSEGIEILQKPFDLDALEAALFPVPQ